MGSTTSSIISEVHIPVLAIPVNYKYRPIKELIYASDLEEPETEIKQIKELAKSLDTAVEMINFNYGVSHADQEKLKLIKTEGINYKELHLSVEHTLAEEMRSYMKDRCDGILCVFSKHKTILRKLFTGSNTNALIEGLKFPLLSCEARSA